MEELAEIGKGLESCFLMDKLRPTIFPEEKSRVAFFLMRHECMLRHIG